MYLAQRFDERDKSLHRLRVAVNLDPNAKHDLPEFAEEAQRFFFRIIVFSDGRVCISFPVNLTRPRDAANVGQVRYNRTRCSNRSNR